MVHAATFPYFFIRTNRRFERVDLNALIYIESCRGYLKLVTDNKTWMVYTTLVKLEELLPKEHFVRIHRGYIVSVNRVFYFDKEEVMIKEADGYKTLPVGNGSYRTALLEKITVIGDTVKTDIA